MESAFLCLIFPCHSTRSSLLLASCPRLGDVYPNTNTPLPSAPPHIVHAYFCTHNCTFYLALKTRQDPAGCWSTHQQSTVRGKEEANGGITCDVAPQEGRRFSLPLLLSPTPLTDSGGYPDAQVSVSPTSDRNICAGSS